MEDLVKRVDVQANPEAAFWTGKRVLVTGHTGFKGSWLCHWLSGLGAEVHGLALAPETEPNLFELTHLQAKLCSHNICDIRDFAAVSKVIAHIAPDITFHMAAQAIVRRSYRDPLESFAVNVMGTAHVLEALRLQGRRGAVINVTSDKCYENAGLGRPFVETDHMGGSDPYSASKGCAEIVAASFQRSFFSETDICLASVRAGNVIGGGDWAEDRLFPDVVRAIESGTYVEIRNPEATRPWQHVLEPLSGYILLAEKLWEGAERFAGGWNFGPRLENAVPVKTMLSHISSLTGQTRWKMAGGIHPKEAQTLHLDISKARDALGWMPVLSLGETLEMTMTWYDAACSNADMQAMTMAQISAYMQRRNAL